MTLVFETFWAKLDDGWSISSRAYARAMALAGIDVRLLSNRPIFFDLDPVVTAEIPESMCTPTSTWDKYLFAAPLAGSRYCSDRRVFETLLEYRPPRYFYTMFERKNVHPELVSAMNQLEGVMVPCSWNLEVLRAAGLGNATWVPYPHFPDDPYLALPPPRSEPRTFLWVGRWERRKAPHNVVRAFFRAFAPGEAKLVLKTSGRFEKDPGYLDVATVIKSNLGGRWTKAAADDDIRVVTDRLSRAEMVRLVAEADIYVSASRGEGLDLPCYQAKLAGRTVVTTDSGGPRDFLGEGDFLVPATGTKPMPEYAWLWDEDAILADYDLGDLVRAMQRARGRRPRRSDMSHFEAANVAKELIRWLG